jgi:hypothetical protein
MSQDFEVWMIRAKGNPVSEGYANYCIPSWTKAGYNVNLYDAVTPDTLSLFLENSNFDFFKHKDDGRQYSDTEFSCFFSHYNLWKKSFEENKKLLILEHDALLVNPSHLKHDERFYAEFFGQHCMEAYLMTPDLAAVILGDINHEAAYVGTWANVLRSLGYLDPFQSQSSFPYSRFIGPHAPVKCVMDRKIGNTILHDIDRKNTTTVERIEKSKQEKSWIWIDLGLNDE